MFLPYSLLLALVVTMWLVCVLQSTVTCTWRSARTACQQPRPPTTGSPWCGPASGAHTGSPQARSPSKPRSAEKWSPSNCILDDLVNLLSVCKEIQAYFLVKITNCVLIYPYWFNALIKFTNLKNIVCIYLNLFLSVKGYLKFKMIKVIAFPTGVYLLHLLCICKRHPGGLCLFWHSNFDFIYCAVPGIKNYLFKKHNY